MKIQFLDCEMLCWNDGRKLAGIQNHIIQIGIVEVDVQLLKITKEHSYFIRPKDRNFEVSDYCTTLTGITRSTLISEGHYFADVMQTIRKEYAPQNKTSYAWGSDFEPIATHCSEYNVSNPWWSGIWDYGLLFRTAYSMKHKLPLSDALHELNLTFEGCPHNALNDARALSHLAIQMMKDIRLSKIRHFRIEE